MKSIPILLVLGSPRTPGPYSWLAVNEELKADAQKVTVWKLALLKVKVHFQKGE